MRVLERLVGDIYFDFKWEGALSKRESAFRDKLKTEVSVLVLLFDEFWPTVLLF